MKKLLPIIGVIVLVFGIWLIFYAKDYVVADVKHEATVEITKQVKHHIFRPRPKPEPKPEPKIKIDINKPTSLTPPLPPPDVCTGDSCPCNNTTAKPKQYTPPPSELKYEETVVDKLPDPPADSQVNTDTTNTDQSTTRVVRRKWRR
jgi:hypothetical protein